MYWWNVMSLSWELKSDVLSERVKNYYFLLWMLTNVVVGMLIWSRLPLSNIEMVSGTIMLGIALAFGWHYNDKNLIERWICLSFPVGLRVLVAFIGIEIVVFLLLSIFGALPDDPNNYIGIAFGQVAQAVYYWRMVYWLKEISPSPSTIRFG